MCDTSKLNNARTHKGIVAFCRTGANSCNMRQRPSIVSDKNDPQSVVVTAAIVDELIGMTSQAEVIADDAARINAMLREKLSKGVKLGASVTQGTA